MEYTIDESVSGLERQKQLAQTMNPPTIRFLDEVGDLSGAAGLDLGCGIGETTRLLGARVGEVGVSSGWTLTRRCAASPDSPRRTEESAR